MALDRQIFILFNERLHDRALDWFLPNITNVHKTLWFWLLMTPILLWILLRGDKRSKTVLLLLALLLPLTNFVSSGIIKPIFHRPRPTTLLRVAGQPETVVPGARLPPHSDPLGTSSFPSSHSAVTSALAVTLIFACRRRSRWAWLALSIPLLIGYSRIYVGVHYPTDVLAGWTLGASIAAVTWIGLTHLHWIPGEDTTHSTDASRQPKFQETINRAV